MAQTATIYNFDVRLSHVDRNIYETLALRVARHPSESAEYLATRVLAYCLEFVEGISFSKGLAEPNEPALSVRDLTGTLQLWVEVGAPDAARLHKASKAVPRVVIYTHRDPGFLVRQLAGERIHRVEELELYGLGGELLAGLVERMERRTAFDLSVSDGHLYLTIGGTTFSAELERTPIA